MKVLMVGCGNMGGALLSQWISCDGFDFTVADPFAEPAFDGVQYVKEPGDVAAGTADLLIVAIKPQLIGDVLPDYEDKLANGGTVCSIAAGASAKRLGDIFGTDAVIRIMPNMPSAIGKGVSGLYAASGVSDTSKTAVDTLMTAAGEAVWVETEDYLDRVTAIAGSGPGYVFEIARVYVEAAEALGFTNEQARKLVLGTMIGASEMAFQKGDPLEDLRNAVTSKNGTTEAGLNQLRRDGLLAGLLKDTTQAAYNRAVELR